MMKSYAASSTEPWQNILIPLDGSEESSSILERAQSILTRDSSAVTFLRVIECSELHAQDPAYLTDSRHWKDRQLLTAARNAFAQRPGTSNAEFRFGDPATEILREILDGGHDVTLLNWHGHSLLGRRGSERVANRVLLSSPAPILFFPAPAGEEGARSSPLRFEKVLVLLDGSPESEEILPAAERMARTLGSDLHLFQAIAGGKDEPARRRGAEEYLSGLSRHLGSRGIVCHVQIRTGPARNSVGDLLREFQLDALAMATRVRSGLARALFGSLANELLGSVRVPVLTSCIRSRRRPIPVSGQRGPLPVE
jgi:nucleotide-binding universal stress UspA family protein